MIMPNVSRSRASWRTSLDMIGEDAQEQRGIGLSLRPACAGRAAEPGGGDEHVLEAGPHECRVRATTDAARKRCT